MVRAIFIAEAQFKQRKLIWHALCVFKALMAI